MIALPWVGGRHLPAPLAPTAPRDDWLTEQVANWRPAPPAFGGELQDRVRDARKAGARHCPGCDTTWTGPEPCWSCGNRQHPPRKDPGMTELPDDPATPVEGELDGQTAIDEEVEDPTAIDTGSLNEVPEHEQVDTDDPEPNEDAGDDCADVEDGEVLDIEGEG